MKMWQKCVWLGAGVVIVVSLLVITRTAETNSPRLSTSGQGEYFSFRDGSRSEVQYGYRDGNRAVIYSSAPGGR